MQEKQTSWDKIGFGVKMGDGVSIDENGVCGGTINPPC